MEITLLLFFLFLPGVFLQAQNDNDLLASKKCLLFNSAFSDTPFEVTVYKNAYSLYYDPNNSSQRSAIQQLRLKEYPLGRLLPMEDSVLGKIVYISPDSVKIVNRLFPVRGNYYVSERGNGIITRDLFIHFKVEMSDSAIHAFYRQNNIVECNTKSGCLQSQQPRFLYLQGDKVLDAALAISKNPLVKQVYNLVEDGRKFKLSNCPCQPSCSIDRNAEFFKKIINGNVFLFIKQGDMPFVSLQIYRVWETDSTGADTVFVMERTTFHKSDFEMDHVIQVADYEITGNTISFYAYEYEWDVQFGVAVQNPELYTTSKTEYTVQPNGNLMLVSQEYGQQDSKMKNTRLNRQIKRRLKRKMETAEHWQ